MSSGNTPNAQGVYSPLPYSDSESEEEVFNKSATHLTERRHESQHKHVSPSFPHANHNGTKAMSSAESSLMADYQPLGNSETSLNGFVDKSRVILVTTSPNESVKFENTAHQTNSKAINQTGWESMSAARKFCFITSILVCLFTIVGFLWFLPCDLESSCSNTILGGPTIGDHSQLTTQGSWESVLQGIELTGPPTFTQGHLIFTVRGPQPAVLSLTTGEPKWKQLGYGPFRPDKRSGGQAGGGALALLPTTGTMMWNIVIHGAAPTAANCELLDMNNNGKRDCLLANSDWILAAVDPVAGRFLWSLDAQRDKSSTSINSSNRLLRPQQRKPAKIIFPPQVVQDLDEDGVSDLLALGSPVLGSSLDCFVLISGKTGTLIGQSVNVSGCVSINELMLEEAEGVESILFNCINPVGGVSVRKMEVEEIYLRAMNKSQQDLASVPPLQKRQQPYRDSFDQSSSDGHSYLLEADGHHLSIENIGTCPKCKSILTLTNERNQTLWSYRNNGERAMAPVSLHFSGTSTLSNSESVAHKNGFVFKLWVWPQTPSKSNKPPRKPNDEEPYHKLLRREAAEDNLVADHGAEEGSPGLKSPVEVIELKERVVLITFSSTDLHVVNASQSNIAILCAAPKQQRYRNSMEPICQPELAAQQKSLLVADLDADGTQELISFTSTYIPVAEPETSSTSHPNRISAPISSPATSWELISKVKVIHLETELSKLK